MTTITSSFPSRSDRSTAVQRPRVLLLFGGRSGEHEVSCATAAGILRAIDRKKWDVIPVGITKKGSWVRVKDTPEFFEFKGTRGQNIPESDSYVTLTEGGNHLLEITPASRAVEGTRIVKDHGPIDVVFPLLHGTYGEDGTVQGFLEMNDVRYVGCGVSASAVCMDKHLTKTILAGAGVEVGRWELITRYQWDSDESACLKRLKPLGFPLFVKPCRAGSSLGITRVDAPSGLLHAIKHAQEVDPRIIVESFLSGHEVECGVLQSVDGPMIRTSLVGEISVSGHGFYDYEAKYFAPEAVEIDCPANIPEDAAARVQEIAARSFDALGCESLARVDCFYDPETGNITVNEVNTMPGFTPFSMYPLAWSKAGIAYSELVDLLIEQALSRDLGLR